MVSAHTELILQKSGSRLPLWEPEKIHPNLVQIFQEGKAGAMPVSGSNFLTVPL